MVHKQPLFINTHTDAVITVSDTSCTVIITDYGLILTPLNVVDKTSAVFG